MLDKQEWCEEYHDIIMNFPLSTEQVWDIEFEIRDFIGEKGYGLINFCNYPLIIDGQYMGHYNSIDGYSKSIRLLYLQIKQWGYDCYYKRDSTTPSQAFIIFPKNVVCEIKEDLFNNLKNKSEVDIDGFLY